MPSVIVKPHALKALRRRHPWVFSGGIAEVKGRPLAGETVDILAASGQFIGRGAYSPQSQIRVRIWTFDPAEDINPSFFKKQLQRAVDFRRKQADGAYFKACRMVNAESDGLPGLIIDRYANFLVCQFLSAGTEYWKSAIVNTMQLLLPGLGIFERSDSEVREKEGFSKITGTLSGQAPPNLIKICENDYYFWVDVRQGHKTGFYLDQRDSRTCIAEFARGTNVLNCFAYTGGFAVAALRAGAKSVTNIDSSEPALELAKRNATLNQLDTDKMQNIVGNVFVLLRRFRDVNRKFDLIILDPPKFAESSRKLDRAGRGYKDINLLAIKMLKPGGILVTFSCSGALSRELFQKIVAGAAVDAGRDVQVIRWLSQPSDHPTRLNFPEGNYLKGIVGMVR